MPSPTVNLYGILQKMDTESVQKRNGEPADQLEALNEINDCAVLLAMANEYVCTGPSLKKIGAHLRQNVDFLQGHLKGAERPQGKGAKLEKSLEGLSGIAESLQKGEEGIKELCGKGRLGDDLFHHMAPLALALKAPEEARRQVYVPPPKKKASRPKAKPRPRGEPSPTGALFRGVLTLLGVILLICFLIFSYLYMSMETEPPLIREIDENRSFLGSAEQKISRMEQEILRVREKVEAARGMALSRQEEIEVMGLSEKMNSLLEEKEKIEIEAGLREEALNKARGRLEVLRSKTFLEKLLRRPGQGSGTAQ
jgi:hypothetical protein